MTQSMFTVPATRAYTDSVTGARLKFYANRDIPLDLAVRFQMPGAVMPDTDTAVLTRLADLADVTITDPQDGDVLTYDADWTNA